MNVIKFVGAMRPDAMERIEEARTLHVRSMYEHQAPISEPYLNNSFTAKAMRWVDKQTRRLGRLLSAKDF